MNDRDDVCIYKMYLVRYVYVRYIGIQCIYIYSLYFIYGQRSMPTKCLGCVDTLPRPCHRVIRVSDVQTQNQTFRTKCRYDHRESHLAYFRFHTLYLYYINSIYIYFKFDGVGGWELLLTGHWCVCVCVSKKRGSERHERSNTFGNIDPMRRRRNPAVVVGMTRTRKRERERHESIPPAPTI